VVLDCVDAVTLANKAKINIGQINKSLIKSELGKIRIAVAGDLLTYLQQTWVNYLIGGAYKQWAGSTIEESVESQTARMIEMLGLAARRFGLPFDYDGFDHQPTTFEIKCIVKKLIQIAALNVPELERAEFKTIALRIVWGFDNAVLIAKEPTGKAAQWRVMGGLMSGLRWTTAVGNAWNSVMTYMALQLMRNIGADVSGIERYIRGDDSAIYTENWAQAALMERCYKAVGARGGEGKFSIRNKSMEFLRTWYDKVCSGYPLRTLPGLTQRKPWSNTPWTDDAVLRSLVDTGKILIRRGAGLGAEFARHVCERWCRLKRLPFAVLSTPAEHGGWGLYPWDGQFRIEPAMPKVSAGSEMRFPKQTDWRQNQWLSEGDRLGIALTTDQAKSLAHQDLADTLASDDVPWVAKTLRKTWNDQLRARQVRAVQLPRLDLTPRGAFNDVFDNLKPLSAQFQYFQTKLKARSPAYGSMARYAGDFEKAKRMCAVNGGKIGDWMRRQAVDLWHAIRHFHSSWDRAERLDYVFGSSRVVTRCVHPNLVGLVQLAAASVQLPRHRLESRAWAYLVTRCEESLLTTHLAKEVYMW
jgi:hypothetical protein